MTGLRKDQDQEGKKKRKSLSRVWLFATPWTVAHNAPLSMGFSRQEYWSGWPFPSPGKLPAPYKGFKLSKGATVFLSPPVCLSTCTFLFNNLFTLLFTLCLLDWIHYWLGRQGLVISALIAGPCGPGVRTPILGDKDLASSYSSLLLVASCHLLPRASKISTRLVKEPKQLLLFSSVLMSLGGLDPQQLETGLQFLARDWGQVVVVRAPNPSHWTATCQWQGPGPSALQKKNSHKTESSETNKVFINRKKESSTCR